MYAIHYGPNTVKLKSMLSEIMIRGRVRAAGLLELWGHLLFDVNRSIDRALVDVRSA